MRGWVIQHKNDHDDDDENSSHTSPPLVGRCCGVPDETLDCTLNRAPCHSLRECLRIAPGALGESRAVTDALARARFVHGVLLTGCEQIPAPATTREIVIILHSDPRAGIAGHR